MIPKKSAAPVVQSETAVQAFYYKFGKSFEMYKLKLTWLKKSNKC